MSPISRCSPTGHMVLVVAIAANTLATDNPLHLPNFAPHQCKLA